MKTWQDFVETKILDGLNQESGFGHHFLQAFNSNKRDFYLRYGLGIVPTLVNPSTHLGSCIHAILEAKYGGEVEDGTNLGTLGKIVTDLLNSKKNELASDELAKLHYRAALTIRKQSEMYDEYDKANFTDFSPEHFIRVNLSNGMPFTVRLDRIAKNVASDYWSIFEDKTTGWSDTKYLEKIVDGDQARSYTLAFRLAYPDRSLDGVIGEVLYSRETVCRVPRTQVITYTDIELKRHEMVLMGLQEELANRLLIEVTTNDDLDYVWPYNNDEDRMFGSDYYKLLNADLSQLRDEAYLRSAGFKVDPIKKERAKEFVAAWKGIVDK